MPTPEKQFNDRVSCSIRAIDRAMVISSICDSNTQLLPNKTNNAFCRPASRPPGAPVGAPPQRRAGAARRGARASRGGRVVAAARAAPHGKTAEHGWKKSVFFTSPCD